MCQDPATEDGILDVEICELSGLTALFQAVCHFDSMS
jgi:hypothetical protein